MKRPSEEQQQKIEQLNEIGYRGFGWERVVMGNDNA